MTKTFPIQLKNFLSIFQYVNFNFPLKVFIMNFLLTDLFFIMFHTETKRGYQINVPSVFNNYKIIKTISSWAFSAVVKVVHLNTMKTFAAKIISKNDMIKNDTLCNIYNEIQIHRSLNHPNIVIFWDQYQFFSFYLVIFYIKL